MDELIEHLQINLGKDFGYEDDVVIEKLRDVMHELRSSRLDYAGNICGAQNISSGEYHAVGAGL